MRKFRFDKLVRDKIVENSLKNGDKVHYRVLDDQEYLKELIKKLKEEVNEIDRDEAVNTAELSDVYEILDAIRKLLKISDADLSVGRQEKNDKAGAFERREYIDYKEVPDDSPWIEYFVKNSDKYPEIK